MTYMRLLGQPAPLLLWLGQLISSAGDRLYTMALMWLVFEMTGAVSLMALVSLSETVPAVLTGLMGGSLIDRWERVRSLVVVDLLRAALVLMLPLAWAAGMLQTWMLIAVAVGLGILGAIFRPSLRAALPTLVRPDELQAMHGLIDTTSRLARLLGPGMAGLLLVYLSQVHFFTLNGLSFFLSACCLAGVCLCSQPVRSARSRSSLAGAWRMVTGDRLLAVALIVRGLNNTVWAVFTLGAPLLAAGRLGAGLGGYGLLLAAYGGGNLAGNLYIGNGRQHAPSIQRYLAGWAIIGLGFVLIGAAPTLAWTLAATALAGLCGPMAHILLDTYLGLTYPPESLRKLYGLQEVIISLAAIVGMPIAAWILTWAPSHLAISGAGVWMIACAMSGVYTSRSAKLVHLNH